MQPYYIRYRALSHIWLPVYAETRYQAMKDACPQELSPLDNIEDIMECVTELPNGATVSQNVMVNGKTRWRKW